MPLLTTDRASNTPRTASPPSAAAAADVEGSETEGRGASLAPVSAVVPCYRCAHTIGQAVASIAAQTLRPAEVLLVDDGSGDGTLQQLEALARSYPPGWIKVIALPRNAGPSAARNRGWDNARQPWIAFLDADDSWHPQKLQWQMEALRHDPEIVLIGHAMNVQSRTAPPPALRQPPQVRVLARHLLMMRHPFPTASIVLRRDLPFRFDETRKRAEDFLLWAQILLSGYRCAKLEQVLASYHKPPFGAGGLSGDMNAMYVAAIDVRRHLHRTGLLGWWQWQLVEAVAWLRHLRRRTLNVIRRPHGARPTRYGV
ncbi:glycosyltransferase family 2 protein [Dyella sp.]|uniref:glycosyltransferase family 2 protein n=1 Tax=Dyella sp. TaxID=1869338 RepID=UPI002B4A7308|nr:glycosyltransferase family 2 protein [Dyella sp.]HKT29555.1 glycosyltransferase family 2 protein [Dyella sp.]